MIKHFRGSHTNAFSTNIQRLWAPVLLKQSTDRPLATANARRWLFRLLALPLLVAGLPAQAINYSFSNSLLTLPPTCAGSGGVYICTTLILHDSDIITVSDNATVTVAGEFTTGASSQINVGGGSGLNFIVGGVTTLGAKSAVKANVTGIGVINVYSQTFIGTLKTTNAAINVGQILAAPVAIQNCTGGVIQTSVIGSIFTEVSGVINVQANSTVSGSLNTFTGAINVGDCSTVGPVISVSAGAVTIGDKSTVNGKISTGSGAVTTGASSRVKGDVSTKVGAITIGAGGRVDGKINNLDTSTAGAVTVGANAIVVGSILTGAGAVTVGAEASTAGVATVDGAITVGARSVTTGSLCTSNSGAITVGANSQVTGNVFTKTAGAITIGADSNVAGAVTSAAARTIEAGATVGTIANKSQCPNEIVAVTTPQKPSGHPSVKSREWRQLFMR